MALMYSPDVNTNFTIPDFSLPAMDGNTYSHNDLTDGSIKVFLFICNHCPYVQAIEERIIKLAHSYEDKNVEFIGVCSNDAADYPEDSFESLQQTWKEKNYGFKYLYDEDQSLAKKLEAICTPDIFVFGADNKLSYRGQLDNAWRDASKVTRQDLKLVIEAMLNKQNIDFKPVPSMGCSIKWK